MGGLSSIQFFLIFEFFLTLQSPLAQSTQTNFSLKSYIFILCLDSEKRNPANDPDHKRHATSFDQVNAIFNSRLAQGGAIAAGARPAAITSR